MEIRVMRRLLSMLLGVLILGLTASCGVTPTAPTGASQPTATTPASAPTTSSTPAPSPPTPTNVPAGWQVYFGQHFTLAYPSGWIATVSPPTTGQMGEGLILSDPTSAATGRVTVGELWGYSPSQLQAMCQLPGTTVTLAGIAMKYTVGEWVHRNWLFINSHGVAYTLDAMDATLPPSVQQVDNGILITFRPDDPVSGCA